MFPCPPYSNGFDFRIVEPSPQSLQTEFLLRTQQPLQCALTTKRHLAPLAHSAELELIGSQTS